MLLDFIIINKFCCMKGTVQRMKQATAGRKYLPNTCVIMEWYPKFTKNLKTQAENNSWSFLVVWPFCTFTAISQVLHFHCHKSGSLPGQGTQVPQAIQSDTPPKKKTIIQLQNGQVIRIDTSPKNIYRWQRKCEMMLKIICHHKLYHHFS